MTAPVTSTPPATAIPEGFDPTDPDVCQAAIPLEQFAAMRATSPVFWVEQTPEAHAGFPDSKGYWALTRHADVSAVSKNSKDWSSQANGAIIRFAPDMTREQVELQSVMIINQDPPDHTKFRQIISRGFTPRGIGALRADLEARTQRIVSEAVEKGTGNFVDDIASELPLQAIADLLGVPQEDRHKLFHWSNQMMSYDDPDVDGDPESASIEILGYMMAMAEERKAEPRDDLVTKLITADVDGHGALGPDEFGYFTIMLTVAGNETTRNAITHGMKAFFDHPDQWELFKRERPQTAYDEIIRWATPVTVFQRTALHDTSVGGQDVAAGERVGLFYASANHDPEVFEDPFTFDITRSPNPHLSFGGHGAHYCIGANLARMEVELIFNAIADHLPDIKAAGEPRRLRHGWINGIKDLQVTYR
ncbi:cytochrome P450 [Nocardioides marmoribigeumensis]|uniref:Cholest-4-en-3-one 26-monooxygenase n=1 Tax=Nocardioides marmoribigeumensis TaxID=433649 RepID=A0ABU2C1V7_9ACTN|nr:cytochrome P450 [Nocardioides marmoribigeumensis]MDR7364554.1 cholest-4-en-3-one 26-monooxygenase [Nocardioides marmoribigeumensis]